MRTSPLISDKGTQAMQRERRIAVIVVFVTSFVLLSLGSGFIFVISASHGHGITWPDRLAVVCLGVGALVSGLVALRFGIRR